MPHLRQLRHAGVVAENRMKDLPANLEVLFRLGDLYESIQLFGIDQLVRQLRRTE